MRESGSEDVANGIWHRVLALGKRVPERSRWCLASVEEVGSAHEAVRAVQLVHTYKSGRGRTDKSAAAPSDRYDTPQSPSRCGIIYNGAST